MKNKIINGILLVAMLFTATSAFVSCKDDDDELYSELSSRIATLQSQLSSMQGKVDGLKSCGCDVTSINATLASLQTAINELKNAKPIDLSKYVTADMLADYAKAADLAGFLKADALNDYVKVDDLGTYVKASDLEGYVKTGDLADYVKSGELAGYVKTGDLEGYVKVEELGGYVKISDIADFVKSDDVDVLATRLETMMKALDADLAAEVKGMITSVNVLATENPVTGNFSLPANVKSTILSSYYNTLPADFVFPSNELKAATGVQQNEYYAGDMLASETAGKVYLTLNPSNVDFSGIELELANSQNEAAPVKLSPLQPSSEVLSFGWTRAGMNLYETTATITDLAAAKLRVNFDNMKSAAQQALEKKSLKAVASFAASVVSEASDIADANYVTVRKESSLLGAREVSSETAIAVASVKPLSFGFFAGQSVSLPVDRIESFINKLFDKVNIPSIDVDGAEVKIDNINVSKQTITVTIVVPAQTVNANGEEVTIPAQTVSQEIDITSQMQGVVNDMVNSFNGNLADINDLLAQVQKLSEFSESVNGVHNEINGYIESFNDKFTKLTGKVNDALQPVLLVSAANKVSRVSTAVNAPYAAKGTVKLLPTTYTAELLAPAYAKAIAVTKINGSTAGVQTFNSKNGLGKVYSGNKAFNVAFEKGKTYEVTYEAVDFYGNVVSRKCYVKGE